MSLTIQLSPATEHALSERANSCGQRPEDVARDVLDGALVDVPHARPAAGETTDQFTAAERLAALEELIAHVRTYPPGTHFVDDSRDFMYDGPDGRGLL